MTGDFAPYAPAAVALAAWAIAMLVLARLSTMGAPRARTESGHPARDYADPAYRRSRAHLNAVETSGPFLAATIAAMVAGGPPAWVNGCAILFLAARIAMAVVHVRTENQLLRSAFFLVGVLCIFGLAALAVVGVVAS